MQDSDDEYDTNQYLQGYEPLSSAKREELRKRALRQLPEYEFLVLVLGQLNYKDVANAADFELFDRRVEDLYERAQLESSNEQRQRSDESVSTTLAEYLSASAPLYDAAAKIEFESATARFSVDDAELRRLLERYELLYKAWRNYDANRVDQAYTRNYVTPLLRTLPPSLQQRGLWQGLFAMFVQDYIQNDVTPGEAVGLRGYFAGIATTDASSPYRPVDEFDLNFATTVPLSAAVGPYKSQSSEKRFVNLSRVLEKDGAFPAIDTESREDYTSYVTSQYATDIPVYPDEDDSETASSTALSDDAKSAGYYANIGKYYEMATRTLPAFQTVAAARVQRVRLGLQFYYPDMVRRDAVWRGLLRLLPADPKYALDSIDEASDRTIDDIATAIQEAVRSRSALDQTLRAVGQSITQRGLPLEPGVVRVDEDLRLALYTTLSGVGDLYDQLISLNLSGLMLLLDNARLLPSDLPNLAKLRTSGLPLDMSELSEIRQALQKGIYQFAKEKHAQLRAQQQQLEPAPASGTAPVGDNAIIALLRRDPASTETTLVRAALPEVRLNANIKAAIMRAHAEVMRWCENMADERITTSDLMLTETESVRVAFSTLVAIEAALTNLRVPRNYNKDLQFPMTRLDKQSALDNLRRFEPAGRNPRTKRLRFYTRTNSRMPRIVRLYEEKRDRRAWNPALPMYANRR